MRKLVWMIKLKAMLTYKSSLFCKKWICEETREIQTQILSWLQSRKSEGKISEKIGKDKKFAKSKLEKKLLISSKRFVDRGRE